MTKNEISAVQSVLNFYGGKCHRYKEVSLINNNQGKDISFKLEISESELMENFINNPNIVSSNVALLFLTNLGKDSIHYNKITVILNFKNGNVFTKEYSHKDILEFAEYEDFFKIVSNLISKDNFNKLLDFFDKSVSFISREKLESSFKPLKTKYGKIQKSQFHGCEILKSKKNGNLVHLFGVNLREKADTRLSLYLNEDTNKIVSMTFDLNYN